MNKYLTMVHYLIAIVFLTTVITAVMPSTFFSKESIIVSLKISSVMNNITMMPADMLHAARMLRREIWDFHFMSGLTLMSITLGMFFFGYKKIKKAVRPKYYIVFYVTLLSMMFTSGLILYLRSTYSQLVAYKEPVMAFHYYTSYLVVTTVLLHILFMAYYRVIKEPTCEV